MTIDVLTVGPFAMNCHVVGCEDTGEGVVIDPGDEVDRRPLTGSVFCLARTHSRRDARTAEICR